MSEALATRPVGLMKVEEARALLAQCKTVDEAKGIRDKAAAIQSYLRTQRASTESQNDAAEIKLRAERRLGELLADQKKNKERAGRGGDRKSKGHAVAMAPPTLRELGIQNKQAERWQEIAKVNPEKFEEHVAGLRRANERVTTAAVTKELRRDHAISEIAKAAKTAEPIEGVQPCAVLYADPPWPYENETATNAGAILDYPTMSLEDICGLKVPALEDSVLFLWATSPLLPDALRVLGAWGFTYKASMVWDKNMGTGNWVLNCHEFLLIGVKGDIPCPAPSTRPKSIVVAPRGAHSAKPDEFAALIERMYPELPRCELFARKPREGWRVWGNQAS